jgi:hypothetical protein
VRLNGLSGKVDLNGKCRNFKPQIENKQAKKSRECGTRIDSSISSMVRHSCNLFIVAAIAMISAADVSCLNRDKFFRLYPDIAGDLAAGRARYPALCEMGRS